MAGKYASMTPYNFGFNDPIFWNDPWGDDAAEDFWDAVDDLLNNSSDGGSWSPSSGTSYFSNSGEAFAAGAAYNNRFGWGNTPGGFRGAVRSFASSVGGRMTAVNGGYRVTTASWNEQSLAVTGYESWFFEGPEAINNAVANNVSLGSFERWNQNRELIPVDLSKANAGDKLLQNLREVYREYRKNAHVRYNLGDIVDLDTKLTPTGGAWFSGFANSTNGYRIVLGGIKARFTIAHERELDGSIIPIEIGSSEPEISQIVYRKFNRPEIRVGDKIVFRLTVYQGINIEIGGVIESSKHAKQMQSDIYRIKSYLGN